MTIRKYMRDTVCTRDDTTMKTKIASFSGQQYSAERDGDELVIYMHSNNPIDEVFTTQDGRPAKDRFQAADRQQKSLLHDMNRRNREKYAA